MKQVVSYKTNKNNATPALASTPNSYTQYTSSVLADNNSTPRTSQRRSVMYSRDWRSALRTPPTYRIGNRTVRFNYHIALLIVGACALVLLFYYVRGSTSSSDAAWLKNYASSTSGHRSTNISRGSNIKLDAGELSSYNTTYPLTQPVVGRPGVVTYRIAMVADLDTSSKVEINGATTVWRSYLKKGHLSYLIAKNEIIITWDANEPTILESSFSLKGRGMELSELVTFNGRILSFDDRTGLIYDITDTAKPVPWVILLDGNGRNAKGFKSEWATVKDRSLYIGSMGKEWTTSMGDFENENPMFVKVVSVTGAVKSIDWSHNYKKLREEASQITWPGYMIHESGVWSDIHRKWFFLPRRCSKDK